MKAKIYKTNNFYMLMMVIAILMAVNVQPVKAADGIKPEFVTQDAIIIEQTSELYIFSIENLALPDAHCNYVYSPSIIFSQGFLDYCNVNYPAIGLLPAMASDLILAYFNGESANLPVGYGGINYLDAFTIDYWDDIVNVLLNPDIGMGACSDCGISGQNISITSADGLVLYGNGQRYEDRIAEFYTQNKQTYANESNYTNITYRYIDGKLVVVTQEVIERECMDVYYLTVKFNAEIEAGIKTGEKTALSAMPVVGGLLIKGLVPGEQFNIYNISGQTVYSSKANNIEELVKLDVKGVYIIKSGRDVVKVIENN